MFNDILKYLKQIPDLETVNDKLSNKDVIEGIKIVLENKLSSMYENYWNSYKSRMHILLMENKIAVLINDDMNDKDISQERKI